MSAWRHVLFIVSLAYTAVDEDVINDMREDSDKLDALNRFSSQWANVIHMIYRHHTVVTYACVHPTTRFLETKEANIGIC